MSLLILEIIPPPVQKIAIKTKLTPASISWIADFDPLIIPIPNRQANDPKTQKNADIPPPYDQCFLSADIVHYFSDN